MPGSEGCRVDEPAWGLLVGLNRIESCWSLSPDAALLAVSTMPAAGAEELAVAHARRSFKSGIVEVRGRLSDEYG